MKRTIQVLLGDEARPVGTLHYDVRGARESAAFTYSDEWLAAKDGFALEPGLPLVVGCRTPAKRRGRRQLESVFVLHGF
jgi:serine/threonine-protein kinase HipA